MCSIRASDPSVGGVAVLLPGGEWCSVVASPVGHDHVRIAVIAAVGHHRPARQYLVNTGVAERGAVVVVARLWPAQRDDQAGVGVNGDLQVGEVPVVLRRCGKSVVTGRDQGAVHDRDLIDPPTPHRRQRPTAAPPCR